MRKIFRFTMPTGARLGNMRHLGGGEFAMLLTPPTAHDSFRCPVLFEGAIPKDETWPQKVIAEAADDPLDGIETQRAIAFLDLYENGRPLLEGCTPGLAGQVAESMGLKQIKPGPWVAPADGMPDDDGWYELECTQPDFKHYAMWTASLGRWFPVITVDGKGTLVPIGKAPSLDVVLARWRVAEMAVPSAA